MFSMPISIGLGCERVEEQFTYPLIVFGSDGAQMEQHPVVRDDSHQGRRSVSEARAPVSYTHLTLPTICSV